MAEAFVAAHQAEARALGDALAELTQDPDAFEAELRRGLSALVDPAHVTLVERVSPDVPATLAVRGPLVERVERPLRAALAEGSGSSALWLAQRLSTAPERDVRLLALPCLERSLAEDPERTWQLLRQMGRGAGDWIEVDALASIWARGVLAEPFRWAELEQLAYSERTMERRLVGATLATIPHRLPLRRRNELAGDLSSRAISMVGLLVGDAEPMVQKSLSWALREWARIVPAEVAALLREQTTEAVEKRDGARAWVVRDALAGQPTDVRAELRDHLVGLRRDGHSPSTSVAAGQAAAFVAALGGTNDAVAHQGARYTRSRA